jgi:death on curing protein
LILVFGVEDFLLVAESVLGIDATRLARVTKMPLAESALAAPFAAFGDHVFYSHALQRAAVLASRVIRNHALPDGNKRVALILMVLYLDEQGYSLTATPTEIDDALRALAAREMTEERLTTWLEEHTAPARPGLRRKARSG